MRSLFYRHDRLPTKFTNRCHPPTTQGDKIPPAHNFPATSDIIESLFGKYKNLKASASYSEVNESILF